MTSKQGVALGLLCGVALGVAACVGVLVWTGERLADARAEAYDEGVQYERGQEVARRDMISGTLNQGLMDENHQLAEKIAAARAALAPMAARDDLPPKAAEAVASALEALK